jgi:hypothetical protein
LPEILARTVLQDCDAGKIDARQDIRARRYYTFGTDRDSATAAIAIFHDGAPEWLQIPGAQTLEPKAA